jgi:hypothetical protein
LQPPEEAGENEAMGHWIAFAKGCTWKRKLSLLQNFIYFYLIYFLMSIFLSHIYVRTMAGASADELAHRLLLTTQPGST